MNTIKLFKSYLPALLLLGFLFGQAWAQTQPKRDDGNIRLTVRKSTQGEVTYLEDQRYLRNEDEVNELLAEYGVDTRVEELAPGEEVEIVLRRRRPATPAAGNEDAAEARPMLGVLYSVEPITLGRVDRVFTGTGAERAGMRVGDIIIGIDGATIRSGDQIRDIIAAHKPGETVRLTYLRNGQKRETLATLGEWRDIPVEQRVPSISPDWQYRYPNNGNFKSSLPAPGYLGVTVTSPTSPDQQGGIVSEIRAGSPAEAVGLQPGDVIVSVNGELVTHEHPTTELIPRYAAGTQVTLMVRSEAPPTEHVVVVTLANRHDFFPQAHSAQGMPPLHHQQEGPPKAWLGVQPAVDPSHGDGALVDMVYDDSPAEALGLRTGDHIVSLDGNPIANWSQLVEDVQRHAPGEVVIVEWLRGGKTHHGTCALGSRQADNPTGFNGGDWEEIHITIRKSELTPDEIEALADVVHDIADGVGSLQAEHLEVFPNPSDGNFRLNLTLADPAAVDFQVFDLQGRKVWMQTEVGEKGNHSLEVDLTAQPAGTYYLIVTQGIHSLVRKLVVL